MAAGNSFRRDFLRGTAITGAIAFLSGFAWSGQKKKAAPNDDSSQLPPPPPPPVADQLDDAIGKMLGAWQLGDIEGMHKYYDENATFVSGAFEPPVVGWQKYVVAYQRQRARIQQVQFIRKNTVIMTKGDFAWAMYQWQFNAVVDGQPFADHGQATLVFAREDDRWLIVHNHTSEICMASAPQQAQPTPRAPALQIPSTQTPQTGVTPRP